MGIELFSRGWVNRLKKQAVRDGEPSDLRLSRFGDVHTINLGRKQHFLEGNYYVCNTCPTFVGADASINGTGWNPTQSNADQDAFLLIVNNGQTNMYLDYITLENWATGGDILAYGYTELLSVMYMVDFNKYLTFGVSGNLGRVVPPENIVNVDMSSSSVSSAEIHTGLVGSSTANDACYARNTPGFNIATNTWVIPRLIWIHKLWNAVNISTSEIQFRSGFISFGGVERLPPIKMGTTAGIAIHQYMKSFKAPPVIIRPGCTFQWSLQWQPHTPNPTFTTSGPRYVCEIGWWER